MPLTVHIINHTHWDREWFLTHVYTNALIPGLIDRLGELVADNPSFRYLLDGQTLILEDLFSFAPHYRPAVEALVRQGNLIVGPYYCQPDWQLTCGEALLRNLLYGLQDAARLGAAQTAAPNPGWLVDTFGHLSQTPQLHRLFGIAAVYVWRGAPLLAPYFHWESPDGSRVLAVNLFGGYRNLYGVTHVPEVAARRLEAEARRLAPYYPTPDIPLLDGYDLEDNPEDPLRFFEQEGGVSSDISLRDSTPAEFAALAAQLPGMPALRGELNSGKYGATFPGTLSSRAYLKIMAHDCERLLYRLCEPLAALASLRGRAYPDEQFERWARLLLQNSIHDCLCGVSIDLVHEKMEYTYHQAFDALQGELAGALAGVLDGFAPGLYAVSTNPYPARGWLPVGDELIPVQTQGVGVWPAGEAIPLETPDEPVSGFVWENEHYRAEMSEDGTVRVGDAILGALIVSREEGDAYSAERGEPLGVCHPRAIVVEERSSRHCILHLVNCQLPAPSHPPAGEITVTASVRLIFDDSPLIRWAVELDSRGADFRVEMVFECGHGGRIFAGMPFDVVARPAADRDLLPSELSPDLGRVLLGQREVGEVRSFPFHEFVALSDAERTSAVLARGLHAYEAEEGGRLAIPLRRSVEWLTRANLRGRVGDAGPFFYVPDAREERLVRHELAFVSGNFDATGAEFQALNAAFQNPPLLVRWQGPGRRRKWQCFQENLPLSSLHRAGERMLVRLHNPAWTARCLSRSYVVTSVGGVEEGMMRDVPPKRIVTLALEPLPREEASPGASTEPKPAPGERATPPEILNPPAWRVGPNRGLPDPAVIEQLRQKAAGLQAQLAPLERQLERAEGVERYRLEHRYYVLRREMYEYLLSARLNELKLAMRGALTEAYLFQQSDEIMALGVELNRMRIKRRIYDYVVQVE